MYPTTIVMTLPPLLKIMCTGTDIENPKAKLFSILTMKNMAIAGIQRIIGTALFLSIFGARDRSRCDGKVKQNIVANWTSVTKRPLLSSASIHRDVVLKPYRCPVHS